MYIAGADTFVQPNEMSSVEKSRIPFLFMRNHAHIFG